MKFLIDENLPKIIVVKMPKTSLKIMTERIVKVISSLEESDVTHCLIIIEPHRIRRRRFT